MLYPTVSHLKNDLQLDTAYLLQLRLHDSDINKSLQEKLSEYID